MDIDIKYIPAQDLQSLLAEAKYEDFKEAIFLKYEAVTKEYKAKEQELKQIRDFLAKLKKMKEMFSRFEAIAKECEVKEIQLKLIRGLLAETNTIVAGPKARFFSKLALIGLKLFCHKSNIWTYWKFPEIFVLKAEP